MRNLESLFFRLYSYLFWILLLSTSKKNHHHYFDLLKRFLRAKPVQYIHSNIYNAYFIYTCIFHTQTCDKEYEINLYWVTLSIYCKWTLDTVRNTEVSVEWVVCWKCSQPIQPELLVSPFLSLPASLSPSVYILHKPQEGIFKAVPKIEKQECVYVWVGGWVIVRDSGRGPVHHKQSFWKNGNLIPLLREVVQ